MMRNRMGWLTLWILVAGGCSAPTSNGNGQTTCSSGLICPAGQFCDDERLLCANGCTSDANCSATELCQRAQGQAVGSCSHEEPRKVSSLCDAAAKQLLDCHTIDSKNYSLLDLACSSGTLTSAQQQALFTCVDSAHGDCSKMSGCAPTSSTMTGCQNDKGCVKTAGLTHEICQGGQCQVGCRADADCGSGYLCDDSSPTFPLCVPQ